MGALKVVLPDELDRRLREAVFRTKGMKKGNLSEAVTEAIEVWVKTQEKKRGA